MGSGPSSMQLGHLSLCGSRSESADRRRVRTADYVLQAFTREDSDVLSPCLDRAVDALESVIHRGIAVAMNQFNVRERDVTEE